jgi:[NiFe] hydrogenase assembly HybE family chaperone
MTSSESDVSVVEPLAQVEALLAAYRRVEANLRDLPVYNGALQVAAVGFRPFDGGHIGVVVTPWFMNLVRLPAPGTEAPAGVKREAALPADRVDLIGAFLEGVPPFEFRPIVSPMDDFASQAQALLTAGEVMDALFTPRAAPPAPPLQVSRAVVAPLGEPRPRAMPMPVPEAGAAPAPAFLAEDERPAEPAQAAPEPLARVTGRRGLFNVFRR